MSNELLKWGNNSQEEKKQINDINKGLLDLHGLSDDDINLSLKQELDFFIPDNTRFSQDVEDPTLAERRKERRFMGPKPGLSPKKSGSKIVPIPPGNVDEQGRPLNGGVTPIPPAHVNPKDNSQDLDVMHVLVDDWTKERDFSLLPTEPERLKDTATDTAIINKFLDDNVTVQFKPKSMLLSSYAKADIDDKKAYNQVAFEIFSKAFEDSRKENTYIAGLDFPSFVKLHNSARDYSNKLMTETVLEGSPEHYYNYVFRQDWGLMRLAALAGYQDMIEEEMSTIQGA